MTHRVRMIVQTGYLLACALVGPLVAKTAHPNVLLICLDDLKPVLGCYGDPLAKTPNIDRLARRGVTFESAYCNQALCSPSRNSLMTGMRPTSMGIYDLTTNFRQAVPDAITLPQYFAKYGFRTEALGKILHTTNGNHEDTASWTEPHFWSDIGTIPQRPSSDQKGPVIRQRGAVRSRPAVSSDEVPDNFYTDGRIADEVVRRFRATSSKSEVPLFVAVGFLKPHLPFHVPKRYWDMHDRSRFKPAENPSAPEGAPKYALTHSEELRSYVGIPAGALSTELQIELLHGYYAAVSYVDAQVGRVLDELERRNLANKTIVVLWGDHGWHLGDHSLWGKKTNYEQATRIPLIIAGPGIAQGERSRALVETVDLYPTLAELAGLPAPRVAQKQEGSSFAATARNPQLPTKQAVFHAYPRKRDGDGQIIGRAVRTERYRLVEWKVPGAAPETADLELYDYVIDALEIRNLAPEKPAVVEELRRMLAAQPEAKPQVGRKG